MWHPRAILLAGVVGCLAGSVGAQVPPDAAAAGVADGPAHIYPLALGGHAAGSYLALRTERLEALAEVRTDAGLMAEPDDAVARALLDLAVFHLAWGFLNEARDIAESLMGATLDPDVAARRDQVAASLSVIDPGWHGDLHAAIEVLERVPGGVDSVFRAYGLQRLGEYEAAAEVLSGSMRLLDALPSPLFERMLPDMLAAAIASEDWFLAHGLAERLTRIHRTGEGALPYLLGVVALGGGADLEAFDRFVEASVARDVWGHRARLAIVRLGLEYDAIGHEEALSMLARADSLWRGDSDALVTLLEMERVAVEAGDARSAALALGRLVLRYPNAPDAETAALRVVPHILDYYAAGRAGDISLDAFIEGHRELSSIFRFTPGYEEASESFADHMLAVGAAAAAAEEYRLTREYMEAAADLGLADPEPDQLDHLRLREAEAHLASGRIDAAADLLGATLRSVDATLLERLQVLRDGYVVRTGERLTEAEADLPRSEEVLRVLARRFVSDGAWEDARDAYVELWRAVEDDLAPADAIGLMIAAERSGDRHLAETIGLLLAERSDELGRVLVESAAPDAFGPELGSASTRALLLRADEALERVEDLANEMVERSEDLHEETQE